MANRHVKRCSTIVIIKKTTNNKCSQGYGEKETLVKYKNINLKDTCTPMFKAAVFTIAKLRKQFKCPATDK